MAESVRVIFARANKTSGRFRWLQWTGVGLRRVATRNAGARQKERATMRSSGAQTKLGHFVCVCVEHNELTNEPHRTVDALHLAASSSAFLCVRVRHMARRTHARTQAEAPHALIPAAIGGVLLLDDEF